ncbi:methylated-DNA--[protein]-cysteine S-methyltransferase [Oscillospiraceae bacterium MB08-C2-2]|nr:methylated-DNA--[protein]-cysteine S-methyltransferase [Oscillospiraceae bacterium MB08-C2-2]
MEYTYRIESPVGLLTVASDGESITGLWLEGQQYYAAGLEEHTEKKELPIFERLQEWLELYFSGKEPDFSLPLAPKGSEYRQAVWKLLLSIPYGTVATYGSLAKQMDQLEEDRHTSARAVGGAVGHNPISILIPCHRVIGMDGSLTGYAGGIQRKIHLLKLEKVPMELFHTPPADRL